MDAIARVTTRIRAIEARVQPPVAASRPARSSGTTRVGGASGFADVLARQVDASGDPAAATLRRPVDAPVSSAFGPRVHPVTGQHRDHLGVDFAAPAGTPIRAVRGGTVAFAGERGGYGNLVIVDHGDGLQTRYAHQASLGASTGDVVAAGALLGTVGSTGLSTGPHLHFEVRRDGEAVDPADLWGP